MISNFSFTYNNHTLIYIIIKTSVVKELNQQLKLRGENIDYVIIFIP